MRSDSATWEKLYVLLAEDDCDQTVYGYRVDSRGRAVKPYLFHNGDVKLLQWFELIADCKAAYTATCSEPAQLVLYSH